MPTGRDRDEQIRRAEERLRARRDSQQTGQGRGTGGHNPSEDPFRHSGLADPRDPGGATHRKPVDVNVVGNKKLFSELAELVGAVTGHRTNAFGGTAGHTTAHGGGGLPRFGAHVTSQAGQAQAASQIAREMKLQVEAADQLARTSKTHLDTMRRVYDQERDAVEELTAMVTQAAKTLHGIGSQSPSPGPHPQGGATTPAGPRSSGHGAPAGGSGGHQRSGGGHQGFGHPVGHGTAHYDPAGLLGNGPIHGGARQSQMALMTHLASGGTDENFDPSQYMTPGRNHPTSYGELRSNLRVRAARVLNQKYGEPNIPTLEAQYDKQGNLTHYNHDPKDGSPVRQIAKDDPDKEEIARKITEGYQGTRMVSSAAGALARGGLGAGLKAIPYVGTAIAIGEGVNEAATWVTDQRQANAHYQAIEGGTNVGTGVPERMAKLGNRLNQRFTGGMTGEQSDQVFDAFTSQGFTGDQRSGYINTVASQYKQTGADPMQTAQMVVTAANHANTGLTNLAASISQVTNTAIQYGVSADQARQTMMTTMDQLAASGMQGQQLPVTAAADTAQVTTMGRRMQGTSYAGMNNETTNRLEAGAMGMPYGQFMAQRENDTTLGPKAQDTIIDRYGGPLTSGVARAAMDKSIAAHGGIDKVRASGELQSEVANEVMQQTKVDPSSVQKMWGSLGMTGPQANPDDPVSGMTAAVNSVVTGGHGNEDQAKAVAAQHQQRDVTDADRGALATDPRSIGEQIGDVFKHPFSDGPAPWNARAANQAAESQSGKMDPTIDMLLDPAQGLSGNKNVGVKVHTKDGDKVVPMQTAVSQYRSQVASGKATIVDPDDPAKNGKSVKEITGGSEDNYQGGPDKAGDTATSDAVDEGKWNADHPASTPAGQAGGGQNVNVTVSADKQLQGWFQFHTGNGGQVQAGAASGQPPQPGGLPTSGSQTP